MASDRFDVPAERLAAVCEKWRVRELSVFGSALREDFNSASDIDLLVQFAPEANHSVFDLVDLRKEMEHLFGRKVDLVERKLIEQSDNYICRKQILANAVVIFPAASKEAPARTDSPIQPWQTWLLVCTLLIGSTYFNTYVLLSRRGHAEARKFGMVGFHFLPATSTPEWESAEQACHFIYYPLIVADNGLGTGMPWGGTCLLCISAPAPSAGEGPIQH